MHQYFIHIESRWGGRNKDTIETRKAFLRKNIVAVSFFQKCAIHPYLNTYLFHYLKSFKHEHLFYLYLRKSSEQTLSFGLHRLIKA